MTWRIERVISLPTWGGHYYEDVDLLRKNPIATSDRYLTSAKTPGLVRVRELSEAVSVGIVFDNGCVGWGDCVSTGRDRFRAGTGIRTIEESVAPHLHGREITGFRQAMSVASGTGVVLPSAIRFGLSQAFLSAISQSRHQTIAGLLAEEWSLPTPERSVRVHAQCGSDRFDSAERMIARRVDSLPNWKIEDRRTQLGTDGAFLLESVEWLAARLRSQGGPNYRPSIHIDANGSFADAFGVSIDRIATYIGYLEQAAAPFRIRIQNVWIAPNRNEQISFLCGLCHALAERHLGAQIVVDEGAESLADIYAFLAAGAGHMIHIKMPTLGGIESSVEAILACHRYRVDSLLGGCANETETSAKITAQVALALQPTLMLAKPGLGVDEALTLTRNEMARTLAQLKHPNL